jgi:formyl-CoA transferase
LDAVRAVGAGPGASMPGLGDHPSAMALFGAIMMALYRRERTGAGGKVSSSLMANGVWSNGCLIQGALCGAPPFQPTTAQESPNALVNHYGTADGRFLFLLLIQEDKDWPRFAGAVGRPELMEDPRFATTASRRGHGPALYAELAPLFASRSLDEWREVLDRHSITFGVMALTGEAPDDAQMIANGLFPELQGDGVDGLRTVTSPISIDGERKVAPRRAPEIGQHTAEVLRELGYAPDRIESLRQSGAVG